MANILELDSVKEYLVNHGGKVKNHDLVTHFKGYLNDPENKNLNRETFKECVNKLASVKSEDGDKMIILKKKYRQASPPKIDENVNPEPNESDISDGGQSSKMASKEGSAEASNDVSSSISSTPERSRESSVGAQADVSRESSVSMEEAGVHEVSPIVSVKDRAVFLNKSIQIVDEDEKDEPSVQMRKKTKVEKTSRQSEDDPGLLNMTDPKEREWMVTSAKSDYQAMARMLLDFPNLAAKKELTSGYTPLHWACKHGEKDVVKLLAGKHKVPTDPRSHGGYTPLHMAALHGHEDLIELLVQTYEADVNIRDYSGKKPKHYLKISAQAHTQRKRANSFSSMIHINLEPPKSLHPLVTKHSSYHEGLSKLNLEPGSSRSLEIRHVGLQSRRSFQEGLNRYHLEPGSSKSLEIRHVDYRGLCAANPDFSEI